MVEKYRSDIDGKVGTDKPLDPTDETKGFVDGILEIEPCPNCGLDLLYGRCEDYKSCGYGHGDDLSIREREKSYGDGEEFRLETLRREEFYYYDYFGRIKENSAVLELSIKGERYFVTLDYKIEEYDDVKTIIIKNIKKIIKKVKGKKDEQVSFYDIRKYVTIVLSDIRFNKFLVST
ncbi:MAG: hypothetical protein PHI37_00450 [Candidatus Gracilibacteria bacterium]|nr:hypothetical protein [Candidatus Gracilibacteria bacterium]